MFSKLTAVTAATAVGIATTMAGAQAVQWKVSDGGNGHWYEIVNLAGTGKVYWPASRLSALSVGGDLACFTSAAETAAFLALTQGQTRGNPWIGLFQDHSAADFSEPAGGWRWTSGEPLVFDNWAPGEPNNAGGHEDWAVMWIDFGPIGTWNDYEPTDPQGPDGFVIEWSADCNNDGIVDYGQCRDGTLADFDGTNIPDCCERGETCVVGSCPVQWRVADGGNGHWYQLVRHGEHLCWSTANAEVTAQGGYLVSETSAAEHNFISARLVARDDAWSGRWGPWIGGNLDRGSWRWTSGEPWSFEAWQPGEPNGGGSETCVSYIAQGEGGGCGRTTRWNDWVNCGQVQSEGCDVGVWNYIVEWSADCNNDGIVDFGQMLLGELPDINHNSIPDTCECIGDIDVDGVINGADLGALLAYWGPASSAAASRACDLNGDGVVNGSDLGILLAYWGTCGR